MQPADGRVRVIPRPEPQAPAGARAQRRTERAEVVVERVGEREFRVDAGGFWQVHRLAAHALTALVTARLRDGPGELAAVDPDAWHLDLYGGVGLFAATLGELGGPRTRVTTVESDPRATEHAGENLAEWVGARAETARVDRWLARTVVEASARRSRAALARRRRARSAALGCRTRGGRAVADLAPADVVYVACDPVALARDLAIFRAAGYETEQRRRARPVPEFPPRRGGRRPHSERRRPR